MFLRGKEASGVWIMLNQTITCAISSSELDNLGPGCYVKVARETGSCWAEICGVNGENCVGMIHNELSEPDCQNRPLIQFSKEQIIDLGCDNYCWC